MKTLEDLILIDGKSICNGTLRIDDMIQGRCIAKRAFYCSAHIFGVNRLLYRLNPRAVVLMYHGVVPDAFPIDSWLFVTQSQFKWQMEYLTRYFDVIPVDAALQHREKDEHQGRRVALVTFDDGYRNNYSWAYPVMKEFGLSFTIFVVTGHIDTKRCFWFDEVIMSIQYAKCTFLDLSDWGLGAFTFPLVDPVVRWDSIQNFLTRLKSENPEKRKAIVGEVATRIHLPGEVTEMFHVLNSHEIREMISSGLVEVGSHSSGHEILTGMDEAEVHRNISGSLDTLETLTGMRPRCFSYPNGDYNDSIKVIAARCGIVISFTTENRFWNVGCDFHTIPRIAIGGYDSHEMFAAKVSGLLAHLSKLKDVF